MKGGKNIFLNSVFIFTVIILLLRPSIIFSFANIQAVLSAPHVTAWEMQKIVKKRPETVRISNIISEELKGFTSKNLFLFFYLYANKKWLRDLFYALSSLLSQSLCFLRKRSVLFDISPGNERYLAVSVIRI